MAAPRPSGGAAIARLVGVLGAILTPAFLFLDQVKAGDEGQKGWDTYSRIDIITLILCIGAVAALGASFVSSSPGLPAVAGALLLCCFGLVLALPLEANAQGNGDVSIAVGAYLALAASLVGSVGAMGAAGLPQPGTLDKAIGAGRGASALIKQPALPQGVPQAVQQSGPAPGWYDDPNRQARLRYFDGSNWTDQVSN